MKRMLIKLTGFFIFETLVLFSSFTILKIIVLIKSGYGPTWSPHYYLQDYIVALLLSLINERCKVIGFVLTQLSFMLYLISGHIAILFGTFADVSFLTFVSQLTGMRDSVIPVIHWELVILSVLPAIIQYFIVFGKKYRPEAFYRNIAKYGLIIPATFFLILPFLFQKIERPSLSRNPSTVLLISIIKAPFRFQGLQKKALSFDYISKFKSNPSNVPSMNTSFKRPLNVILIMMESTGTATLSPRWKEIMPNFWKLAEHGVYFENFYANVPLSIKSIFSVHTGQDPAANMRHITAVRPRIPLKTLAEYLKEAGYRTALLHGGHFTYTRKLEFLRDRGYDLLYDAHNVPDNEKYEHTGWGVDDAAIYEYAKKWVLADVGPFLLTLIPILPHHPYHPPANWGNRLHDNSTLGLYYNSVYYEDHLLGELIQFLKNVNLFNNTLLVVVADHGEAFGQHKGNYIHSGRLYEENIHVPLLMSNPTLFKSSLTVSTPSSMADILPTILDILQFKVNMSPRSGKSLLKTVHDRLIFFYTGLGGEKLGLRDGNYKYIYNVDDKTSELYNVKDDPPEQVNLADMLPERSIYYKQKIFGWRDYSIHFIKKYDPGNNNIINLIEVPPAFISQDWGQLTYNRSVSGNQFRIAGKEYRVKGIGTHANSIIMYDITNFEDCILSVKFGRDEEASHVKGKVRAEIWVDGTVVYSSREISSNDPPVEITIPVNGNRLSLVSHMTDDGGHSDHVDWIEPLLIRN